MNTEPVDIRTNIIANGHFDKGFADWEDTDAAGNSSLKTGTWEGVGIHYMSLFLGSGITQQVYAPARLTEGMRYTLSFLYGNNSEHSGTFILGRVGSSDRLEIPLPVFGYAVADAEGRALNLRLITELIDFEIQQDDVFEVTILSPRGATARDDVIVARIELRLELEPLVLAQIENDGQVFIPGDTPTLYLCYGATAGASHQLLFEPEPDSPWAGTPALLWSFDNPEEAVVVSPVWGENQLIEAMWQVDCPPMSADDTRLFELFLYSKYHAAPYPIEVSLGHHRLAVETVLEPAYQPVIEYGQSVTMGVRVKSHYLDLPMLRYEVCWMLEGEVLARVNTDGSGEATFDFTPATAGLHALEARVESAFFESGYAVQTINVQAHATDPLKTVHVQFPDMEAGLWGTKTGLPDRGATYDLTVLMADDSPLQGMNVWLAWEGKDPDELTVTVEPALLQPVLVAGAPLIWTLNCGDVIDGEFGLRLACAQLQTPTVINAMSLARHSVKIGDVREANRVPVVDEHDYVWCMLQVQNLGGLPVTGVPVEWDTSAGLQRTYTGMDGWASVIDRPAEHGDYNIAARVNPREGRPMLGHTFAIQTLATSAWRTASFMFAEAAVDRVGAGVVCQNGQEDVLHFKVEPSSPLIGKEIHLSWREPTSSIVIAEMEVPTVVPPEGVTWTVQASSTAVSGVFDLEVLATGMEPLALAFRLLPQDLAAQVSLVFDQARKDWDGGEDLYPCIGASHDLTILPIHDLGGLHGLLVEACAMPDLPPGWVITPSLTQPSPMTAGGVRYHCDFTGTTDAAQRTWTTYFPELEAFTQPSAIELKLDHNKTVLGTSFEVATDPVLNENESARLAVQYLSAFNHVPVNNVLVEWSDGQKSRTGPDGVAQTDYQPATAGSHNVQALVQNRYDGTQVEHAFTVKAYDESPWLDFQVSADSGPKQPWGGHTLFPRRGNRLNLTLSALRDSPLFGQKLALGVSGGQELDSRLIFGPVDLGAPRVLTDDLSVSLQDGDQTNAAFSLQFSASRLLARSPLNAFSLGPVASTVEMSATNQTIQDVKVGWRETLSFEVTLTNKLSGRPAKNIQVQWRSTDQAMESVTTETNFYGTTRIGFIATTPGAGKVTASVVGGTEVLDFNYHVHEACIIDGLESNLLEGPPGQDIVVDATVLSASTGEPVEGVLVRWFFKGLDLQPVATDAQGKAQLRFKLPPWIGNFVLSASVPGEFGRDAARLVFTVLETEETWPGEFELWLNGTQLNVIYHPLNLTAGIDNILELKVRKHSNLIGTTLSVEMDYAESIRLRLVFRPGLQQAQLVKASSLRWTISTESGAFGTTESFSIKSSRLEPLIKVLSVVP